jgi:DNA-binding transcriptional MocR family regulator
MTIWQPEIVGRKEPKYLAIANAIEDGIQNGRLQQGDRLPPHRELADELHVTVGTVTRGYAEAERRGLTHGEIGRGTFIAPDVQARHIMTFLDDASPHIVDLSLVFPLYSLDPDLRAAMAKMAKRASLQSLLQYQQSQGKRKHREAGAQWLRRTGLECSADDILVCSGGQHALTILLGSLFKPGDRILAEEVTYCGIKPLANMFQLRLEPIALDEHGMLPEAVEAACARKGVKGLYTIPSFQNPTTTTLSESRRRDIATICRKHDVWIIEDDCYLMTMPDPPLPLFSYAPDRTFFVGSLSKTLAAGLRIAFLLAPRNQIGYLESAITHTIWMTSPILAELATMWIEDGTADTVMRNKRGEAEERNLIARQCLKGLKFNGKPTGYYLWLELPKEWNISAFQEEAFRRQVALVSTEQFVVGNATVPNGTRLSLTAAMNREALAAGLTSIAEILSRPPRPQKMMF